MKHKIFRPENVGTEHSHSLFSERKSSVFLVFPSVVVAPVMLSKLVDIGAKPEMLQDA